MGLFKKLSNRLQKVAFCNPTGNISNLVEHAENLPDWGSLLTKERRIWSNAKVNAQNGPDVLIATTVGGFAALSSLESLLAVALTLRGARVHTLLCDAVLPTCLRVEYPTIPDPQVIADYGIQGRLCNSCQETGQYLFGPLGLVNHKLSELIDDASRQRAKRFAAAVSLEEIPDFRLDDVAVGEHAYAGALRYFASGNLYHESLGEVVVRRYLEAAILTAEGLNQLTRQYPFVSSCFNHGIYCPQGVIGDVLRKAGSRVVNWNIAYRKKCFIFSHNDTYHHTLLEEPVEAWETMPWTDVTEAEIKEYLRSRWQGSNDWIWFHEKPEERFEKIAEELDLDRTRPIIGMLTNVMWDAQLHYRANAFPNMLSWVMDTIRYFAQRSGLQLVIRIHPAEIRGTLPSRQPLLHEIQKEWQVLPPNVKVIPPESQVSTYAVMEHCDSVLIYGTKTGVELTSIGIPVIVAGEAWIRNKGVTLDASSRDEYIGLLNNLPLGKRLDDETRLRALKYAYHFFYRRMIPLDLMEPTGAWPPYRPSIESLEQLMPGRDTGLDIVCDGIMNGTPFVYPAELLSGGRDG
ncbi:capsule biosynthesis protein [Methylocaldum sp.]|uniref:capsule biosynthesis protein n=1 Tax=Methylocaldum sp. TaxID=1969727 RepID=UPI00321F78E3